MCDDRDEIPNGAAAGFAFVAVVCGAFGFLLGFIVHGLVY